MKFLNKETEALLKTCIDNSSNYPRVLADMFDGLSFAEEERLREQIKTLIDNGYITKLQWADNVPWYGRITEAGYDYFHKKDVYIRAKLKERDDFNYLDEKAEKVLRELIDIGNPVYVGDGDKGINEIMTLSKNSFVSLTRDKDVNGQESFVGWVNVTEAGKNYFDEKEKVIEEILLLSEVQKTETQDNSAKSKTINKKNHQTKPIKLFDIEANDLLDNSETSSDKSGKLIFCGILGNNCGTVQEYRGADAKKKEKGFIVENGIPTLRGYAKISDIAKASHAQYEDYQRKKDPEHADEIAKFLLECRTEAKFLPEVILSINDATKAKLTRYDHKSFAKLSETAKGVIDNLEYYTLEVAEGALTRVDGNHRLEAGEDKDYYVPFAIIVWNVDYEDVGNILLDNTTDNNTESEAFLFYILNNTAKKLEAEENFKGLVKSKNWSEEELALINKYLPILKYFNDNYASNPMIDNEILYAPLSQICDILTEIDSPDLDKETFDILLRDALKLTDQSEKYQYCREHFSKLIFQLAFYTRYKSDNYADALHKLNLVDKWLEKYNYTYDTFTKAAKIFDVADKFLSVSPKYIFMAMEYKSEQIVTDYNNALSRAVHTINNMGGNVEVEAYPIMTGKGKSFSITSDIYTKIESCSIFIADTTEANPNVMYELGIAYDKKKPIIMVREKRKHIKVPSDIISDYYYNFAGMTELENLFVTHIIEILIKDYGAVFPE